MCQLCVDPNHPVSCIVDSFSRIFPDSDYGPAHVVIADGNLEDYHIQWVLDHWDDYTGDAQEQAERAEEYVATKALMMLLLTIPESARLGKEE